MIRVAPEKWFMVARYRATSAPRRRNRSRRFTEQELEQMAEDFYWLRLYQALRGRLDKGRRR